MKELLKFVLEHPSPASNPHEPNWAKEYEILKTAMMKKAINELILDIL
jgi:hypothetical protein